jgi:hypothetical protein
MSINSLHAELMKNLESAVDMGKFLGVFNTLIGVIKDQQTKIDELGVKSEKMAQQLADEPKRRPSVQSVPAQLPPAVDNSYIQALEDKISALETRLNDTLLELHGLGEDSSILDREEEPPEFLSLPTSMKEQLSFPVPQSKRFIATAPAIHEAHDQEDDDLDGTGSPMGFSRDPSRGPSRGPSVPGSKRASFKNETVDDDDQEVASAMATPQAATKDPTPAASKQPSVAPSPAPVREESPAPQPSAVINSKPPSRAPSPAVAPEPVPRDRSPTPPPPAAPPRGFSPNPARKQRSSFGSEDGQSPQTAHAPNRMGSILSTGGLKVTGLLTVTPMELRPSTMRESFSTKMQQVEHELFPNREELTSQRYVPHSKEHLRAMFTEGKQSCVARSLLCAVVERYLDCPVDSSAPIAPPLLNSSTVKYYFPSAS